MFPYIHIGPLELGTFGIMMWLAFLAGFFLSRADMPRRRLGGDPQLLVGLMALAGIVGSKLWHVFETPSELFAHPFVVLVRDFRYGFAWFGGFLAATLTLIWFARRHQIPTLKLMDAAAPATALGYAIGRIGCLTSGDGDYGTPTLVPLGMTF